MQYAAGALKRQEREIKKIRAATFVGLVATLRVPQSRRREVAGLAARAKFEYRDRLPRLYCSELLVNRTEMSPTCRDLLSQPAGPTEHTNPGETPLPPHTTPPAADSGRWRPGRNSGEVGTNAYSPVNLFSVSVTEEAIPARKKGASSISNSLKRRSRHNCAGVSAPVPLRPRLSSI